MAAKTAVITGASSGIGEAIALELAKRQYNLVLASRNQAALDLVAARCTAAGARAYVVPTDVSKPQAMQHLANKAAQRFGRFDVWINDASVIFYGRFQDIKAEEFRKVIETNLFGVEAGSRAALRHFRQHGDGILINIASGLGAIPAPYASSYVTSKFAVRGLTASIAQELRADGIRYIHACCVLPATIDTPVYRHGGNRMQHKVRAMPPVYSVHTAVRKIVTLVDNPKPEIVVGNVIRILGILYALMPNILPRLFAHYVRRYTQLDEPNRIGTTGNLYQPGADGAITGGWGNTAAHRHKEGV